MNTTPSKDWLTIPFLPCISVIDTLAFWEQLGYTITYQQTRPYQYGVVERNGYALHFVYIKGLQAANSYTGCLVIVTMLPKYTMNSWTGSNNTMAK